jgi:Holliday junction resolvase RusA-like endonuclease
MATDELDAMFPVGGGEPLTLPLEDAVVKPPPEPEAPVGPLVPAPRESFPPPGAVLVGEGVVVGQAKPGGSKDRFGARKKVDGKWVPVINEKTGMQVTRVVDQSARKGGPQWRKAVQAAIREAIGEPVFDQPLVLEVTFLRERSKSDFGTGRNAGVLKQSAPAYPQTMPDAVKLMRAFEDALKGIAWKDDARNVDVLSRKRFVDRPPAGDKPEYVGAEWRLWTLPETVADLSPSLEEG